MISVIFFSVIMTESILDFDNDKEFPLATVFYCLKITGLWTHVVLVRTHYFHLTIVEANNDVCFNSK